MRISVVIPAHNAENSIAQCLTALENQTYHHFLHEVIVVDNNCTDRTAEITQTFDNVTLIQESTPGAGAARNAGISHASGDIICFTDADCAPVASWLEEVCRPLENNPEIVATKGTYLTEQSEITARFVQIEYEDKYDLLLPQTYINFIDTYSAAYRRDILVANDGGFDERFTYLEDQELSFRLAARGYKMAFQPAAKVFHLHSNTLRKYFRKKYLIAYWKAQVVRRFPQRGVKDSHTPQVMKIQMGLIMLFWASLIALPLLPVLRAMMPQLPWGWLSIFTPLFLLSFIATTVPFIRKAWPKDRLVAIASPFLLIVRATALSIGYIWGVLNPKQLDTEKLPTIGGIHYLLKRSIDVFGATIGLFFTILLSPFIAIAIKSESRGPIIFTQRRIGQEGEPFTIYKFRSMYEDAEKRLDQLIDIEKLEEPAFKIKGDPRITKVGAWLRRWSLDELPQFWNVFKGDMSLVGPRPEEARIVELYEDHHRRRLMVKPGMSGPMQINGRGDLPFHERIRYELNYIENYTILSDLQIIWKTIPAIIKGRGAH